MKTNQWTVPAILRFTKKQNADNENEKCLNSGIDRLFAEIPSCRVRKEEESLSRRVMSNIPENQIKRFVYARVTAGLVLSCYVSGFTFRIKQNTFLNILNISVKIHQKPRG